MLTIDVLVISKRVVPRLADLNPDEVTDLFHSVQRVGRVVEKAFSAEALNIAVQVRRLLHIADSRMEWLLANQCPTYMSTSFPD